MFGKCKGVNHSAKGDAVFCFECDLYPCIHIERVDDRYRKNFGISLKENLEFIRSRGLGEFIRAQYEKYRCLKCGGLISVHNKKCFGCDTITKLVDISRNETCVGEKAVSEPPVPDRGRR